MENRAAIQIQVNQTKIDVSGVLNLHACLQANFQHIGRLSIMLDKNTRAEIDIWLEVVPNADIVNRFFLVQNEYHIHPSSKTYHYHHDKFVDLRGIKWQRDNFIWKNDLRETESDSVQVHLYAAEKGYQFPIYMMNNRLMHVYGEKKQGELLLIYGENAQAWKHMIEGTNLHELHQTKWQTEIPDLQQRAWNAMNLLNENRKF